MFGGRCRKSAMSEAANAGSHGASLPPEPANRAAYSSKLHGPEAALPAEMRSSAQHESFASLQELPRAAVVLSAMRLEATDLSDKLPSAHQTRLTRISVRACPDTGSIPAGRVRSGARPARGPVASDTAIRARPCAGTRNRCHRQDLGALRAQAPLPGSPENGAFARLADAAVASGRSDRPEHPAPGQRRRFAVSPTPRTPQQCQGSECSTRFLRGRRQDGFADKVPTWPGRPE